MSILDSDEDVCGFADGVLHLHFLRFKAVRVHGYGKLVRNLRQ